MKIEELKTALKRAKADGEKWRTLLANARTVEGSEMAIRAIEDAQKREREALKALAELEAKC